MKINFTKLIFTDLEGNTSTLDCSKQLANFIYSETQNLDDLMLAQDIYKLGEVELIDEQIEKIREVLRKGFKAFVQKAFEDTINNIKNTDVQEVEEIKD